MVRVREGDRQETKIRWKEERQRCRDEESYRTDGGRWKGQRNKRQSELITEHRIR